jgi:hypothetical protein
VSSKRDGQSIMKLSELAQKGTVPIAIPGKNASSANGYKNSLFAQQ